MELIKPAIESEKESIFQCGVKIRRVIGDIQRKIISVEIAGQSAAQGIVLEHVLSANTQSLNFVTASNREQTREKPKLPA